MTPVKTIQPSFDAILEIARDAVKMDQALNNEPNEAAEDLAIQAAEEVSKYIQKSQCYCQRHYQRTKKSRKNQDKSRTRLSVGVALVRRIVISQRVQRWRKNRQNQVNCSFSDISMSAENGIENDVSNAILYKLGFF